MSEKKDLAYLDADKLGELAEHYEFEKCFYRAIGAKDDFTIITLPSENSHFDGEDFVNDDEELKETILYAIEYNLDVVYHITSDNGNTVAFVYDPVKKCIKSNSSIGYMKTSEYDYHS